MKLYTIFDIDSKKHLANNKSNTWPRISSRTQQKSAQEYLKDLAICLSIKNVRHPDRIYCKYAEIHTKSILQKPSNNKFAQNFNRSPKNFDIIFGAAFRQPLRIY